MAIQLAVQFFDKRMFKTIKLAPINKFESLLQVNAS